MEGKVFLLFGLIICVHSQLYGPCSPTRSILPWDDGRLPHSIAYNSIDNEYLMVFVVEFDGGSSVMAVRLDSGGFIQGNGNIPLMLSVDYPGDKANPIVRHSTVSNYYTALWEYTEGNDTDIWAIHLSRSGSPWDTLSRYAFEDNVNETLPYLLWNPDLSQFLFVYQRSNVTMNLFYIRRLNEDGVLTEGVSWTGIRGSYSDSSPRAAWNPVRQTYALVFDAPYMEGPMANRSIWMIELDQQGNPGAWAYEVGALPYIGGDAPHLHSPFVRYAPSVDLWTIVFEVMPDGPSFHASEIAATSVDPSTFETLSLSVISAVSGVTSSPGIAYSSDDASFVVVFQYIRGNGYGVRGAHMNPYLYVERLFELDVNSTNSLTDPQIIYNTKLQQYMTTWLSSPVGSVSRDVTPVTFDTSMEPVSVKEAQPVNRVGRKIATVENQEGFDLPRPPVENVRKNFNLKQDFNLKVDKRQLTPYGIRGVQLCQTGTPPTPTPEITYEVNKGAIIAVVVIGFVMLCGCSCAVLWVAIVKPRRERRFQNLQEEH